MVVDDLYENEVLYVDTAGMILCNVATKKISDALVTLLTACYIYNVQQNEGKNVYYCFHYEYYPWKIGPASIKSLVGVLSNVWTYK